VSKSVFRNLLLSMLGFGAAVGLIFPVFARVVLDAPAALSPLFFAMCLGAGLLVGAVNYGLFSLVVSRALGRLVYAMGEVHSHMATADCAGLDCAQGLHLDDSSQDGIGATAGAFNTMLDAIATRMGRDGSVHAMLEDVGGLSELDEVADSVLGSLCEASDATIGVLWVGEGDGLSLRATRGQDLEANLPATLDTKLGAVATALGKGDIHLVQPDNEGMGWVSSSTPLGSLRPHTVALVPLVFRKRTVGLALLSCSREAPQRAMLDLVEELRSHAAAYLHTAALNQRMKQLAAIDDLTGVLNRRFGIKRLREEFSRSVRHGVPLSVLLVDVDHFKRFNDTWGHDAGDEVLRRVASTIEGSIRAGDVLCRYGGEEFLVVAPGTGLADAARLGDRLRRSVEAMQTPWQDMQLAVTMSMGVATWPNAPASQPEELVSSADVGLYHAKENGRNRLSIQHGERLLGVKDLYEALGIEG
jgi:two-component system, cell cycle response regulator